MNAKVLLAGFVASSVRPASPAPRSARTPSTGGFNGANSISVNPGDLVTVTGHRQLDARRLRPGEQPVPRQPHELGCDGHACSTPRPLGLGRNASLRLLPQALMDSTAAGVRSITGPANAPVDAAQLQQAFNPLFNGSNPIEVFRFMFVAGNAGRTVDIGSQIVALNLFSNAQGVPTAPYTPSVDGAQIQIVPTPGSLALVGLSGLTVLRRRRRN